MTFWTTKLTESSTINKCFLFFWFQLPEISEAIKTEIHIKMAQSQKEMSQQERELEKANSTIKALG